MRLDGSSDHPSFKGGAATYSAFHKRVSRLRGTPTSCEECGLSDPGRRYEWANLTGDYGNPLDYRRMCVPCHRRMDLKPPDERPLRSDNTSGVRGVEYRPDLWPANPWRASIRIKGRLKYLGLFASAREATEARVRAETEKATCV